LNALGVLDVLFPELIPGRGIDQGGYHHLDVLNHQLEAVAQGDRMMSDFSEFSEDLRAPLAAHVAEDVIDRHTRKALIKLASLYHDVGKPGTRRVKADGEIWFIGHEHFGADLTGALAARLRLSNREAEMIHNLVLYHLRPGFLSREPELTRRAIFKFFRDLGDDGPACGLLWWTDRMATRGPSSRLDQVDQQRARLEELLRAYFFRPEEAVHPPKLIDGRQLMEALSLAPGPRVGELLRAIEEAQAEGKLQTSDDALAFARELASQA
jgi:putative nucleotidyltransferase with HDIG domain